MHPDHRSIPPTPSDELLISWGFDLRQEYWQIAQNTSLQAGMPVLEMATGTGRMTAVLTRLGCAVSTGDVTQEKADELWRRVTATYAKQVSLICLDMCRLPFRTCSVGTIVCLNTLHELADPRRSIEEMLRIHDRSGMLVIGDFSDRGFEAMQKVHEQIYGNNHPRGSMAISSLEPLLRGHYRDVKVIHTPLNVSLLASGNK